MKKLSAFLETVISLIGLAILSLLSFVTLTRTVNVVADHYPYETVKVVAISSLTFVFILIFAVLLWLSQKWLKRLKPRYAFFCGSFIIFCLGIYLIFACEPKIRFDQRYVLIAAYHLNHHQFHEFAPCQYLNQYPFQLGFVTFERPFAFLFGTNAIRALFLLNLLCLLGIHFFNWQITALVTAKKRVQNYVILLDFFFLPAFFYILFAYGNLPGLLLLMASFYCLGRWWQQNKWPYWLLASILSVLAYELKNNYLIGIIALIIASLLNFLRTKKWANLAFIAVTILLLAGSNYALNTYYSGLTHQEVNVSKGIPKSLYLVMGLSKNPQRSDGWYDGSTVKTYCRFKGNHQRANDYGDKQLRQKTAYFAKRPDQAAKLFKNKIVTTWGDPLFQSIWSGPHRQFRQKIYSPFWRTIYNPHTLSYHLLDNFCHALYIIILITALICSWHYLIIQHQHLLLLLLIYFIGGFCFHLLWETKSQYVFNYIIALLPLSAAGLDFLIAKLQLKIQHKLNKQE